ncbi:hypothetical protein [Escherichia phage phiWec179]|nr:hypothetical protein [Escherichia phage phiWec179]BDU12345.1 hypothetical protein [Escherichia phage phiWec181]BDU12785.1 hypothetical protein [Escherichia phage phiWec186]
MSAILQELYFNIVVVAVAVCVIGSIYALDRTFKKRNKQKEFRYDAVFVYNYRPEEGNFIGTGNIDVQFTDWPPSLADIREVETTINDTYGYDGVVMINILPVSKDKEKA